MVCGCLPRAARTEELCDDSIFAKPAPATVGKPLRRGKPFWELEQERNLLTAGDEQRKNATQPPSPSDDDDDVESIAPSPILPPTPWWAAFVPQQVPSPEPSPLLPPTPVRWSAPKATPTKSPPQRKFWSPWSRPNKLHLPPVDEVTAAYLADTAEQRAALVDAFFAATATIQANLKGESPLRDYFVRIGRCEDPSLRSVALDDHQLVEFRGWLPPRQAAAILLLCYNPYVTSVVLNGCALDDSAGAALSEVLRRSKSLTSLSVERNDLREPGLLRIVDALHSNTVLTELRINHQQFTVSTPVEEALHVLLHTRVNTTLCKLGLVVRNEVPKNRIDAALMRNLDEKRVARREATRRSQRASSSGTGSRSLASALMNAPAAAAAAVMGTGGGGATTSDAAPKKRQLSAKLATFAAGLEGALAPFDVDGLVADLKAGRAPSCNPDGSGLLNVNNDVKVAKLTNEEKCAIVSALSSGCVKVVELANVQLGDAAAVAMAEVLRANKQSIVSINLEGNLIGSNGIEAIAAALPHAPMLAELRLDHQVGAVCSAAAEMSLAHAVDAHPRLHKLSYTMRQTRARDLVGRATMRNRDKSRLERQSTKKLMMLPNNGLPPKPVQQIV